MKLINRAVLATLAVLVVVSVTGCNTVRGVGKDIKKGGEAIEKAAQ